MRLFLACGLALSLTGCATILNEKHQKINVVSSNNTPITGTINGIPFSGPGIVAVERAKSEKIIMVDSPKCTKQTLLTSSVDTPFWINILTGGTFGSTTDYSSEKMWKYQDTVIIPCN